MEWIENLHSNQHVYNMQMVSYFDITLFSRKWLKNFLAFSISVSIRVKNFEQFHSIAWGHGIVYFFIGV